MTTTASVKMTPFILESLKVLGYSFGTEGLPKEDDEFTTKQCQNLVLWLEESKIRLLPIADRVGLRCTNESDLPKWVTHLCRYLRALNVSLNAHFDWNIPAHRLEVISHLLILALQDDYLDAKEARSISDESIPKANNNYSQDTPQDIPLPLDEENATQLLRNLRQTGFLKESQTLFDIPPEHLLMLLQCIQHYISLDKSSFASTNLDLESDALPLAGDFEHKLFHNVSKVLRSLHIARIQALERLGNLTIAQLQSVVSDPQCMVSFQEAFRVYFFSMNEKWRRIEWCLSIL